MMQCVLWPIGPTHSCDSDLDPSDMPAELMSAIAFLTGALVAMMASTKSVSNGAALTREILKQGNAAQGLILRIWRPPLLGSFTRVYFEFRPQEGREPVRACHVDLRYNEPTASLPAVGTLVSVRYMPEDPTKAVIAKLVPR